MRYTLALVVWGVAMLTGGLARADEEPDWDNVPVSTREIGPLGMLDVSCRKAKAFTSKTLTPEADLALCHGALAVSRWPTVTRAAEELLAAARAYIGATHDIVPACEPDQPPESAPPPTRAATAPAVAPATVAPLRAKFFATRVALSDAVDAALDGGSVEQFEAVVRDPKRVAACKRLHVNHLASLAAKGKVLAAEDKQAETAERMQAHASDILRRAPTLLSGALSGNGFVEQAGSPDHVVFSVMTALGADQRTNGSQIFTSLNVASLFTSTEQERLALPPVVRNMSVRAALPLTSTEPGPPAGTVTAAPPETPEVSRFSLVAGSSFLDETDTRLPSNADCYAVATAYARPPESATRADDRRALRQEAFDVCNRIAANRTRLSWRYAIGFVRPTGEDERTRAEVLAGALVWGPVQWLYVNALFQGYLEPSRVNAYGAGLSLGGNVGGRASGVDAWARVGLDVLAIYTYALATSTAPSRDDVEVRITPTIRAKVLGSSFASIGIGPRILASDPDRIGLLASLALTYDADQLIDRQLTAPLPPR